MKYKYLILILLFTTFGYSQKSSLIDSLKGVVLNSANDSLIMDAYNKLRRETYYNDAEASRDYAIKYLEYAQKRKDSHHIVLAYFFIGNGDMLSTNYDDALTNYLIAASYYEKQKDSARLTSVLNSIGAVYEKTKNDSLSIYYYTQARTLGKLLNDYRRSGIASVNIGNIYNNQNKIDKAIYFLEDAVKDLSTNENHLSFLNLAELNLAGAYGKNNQLNKSFTLYNKLLTKIDTINDVYNYANVLRGISNVYQLQKKSDEALPYAEKAFLKYTLNNFKDERFQMFPELISIYRGAGNPSNALELYDEYQIIKDSLLTAEKDKNIAEAHTKYESEKKDAQLKVLSLENEKAEQQQKLYSSLALAGLLITGLIGFFLYKNQKKNRLLAKQKILLEATIDEKNVLLKETHHRVKNSFQMVSSLLYLQSENIQDKEAQLAMKEAQNRVRSMVLIHQKLYSKDQLVGIDTKEYIEDLARDIFESHQFENSIIKYEVDAISLILNIETITSLGLIVNELITNVLKHAFTKVTDESIMKISLKRVGENLQLIVEDNGQGMSEEIKESSFGIRLIKALAKKLKATLSYTETQKGTMAVLDIQRYTVL